MNKFALALTFAAAAIAAPLASAVAAPPPCETALKDLRAAEAKATLNDGDKNKVSELETKGIAATPTTTSAPTTSSPRP